MIELGEALEAEADFAEARQQFEQTLSIRQKVGQSDLAAESQVELAVLCIEEGQPAQAEGLLRTALAEFEKEKGDPDSASAYTNLSRALLLQGRTEEARVAVDRAMQFGNAMSDPALKITAVIQKARVAGVIAAPNSAAFSGAQQELKSTIATAKKLGYYTLEAEARLVLGQMQLKAHASIGRTMLNALAAEAQSRGLTLLARRIQEALAPASNVVAENRPAR
jgi:tetratricopeptide (TPR) repeat protein